MADLSDERYRNDLTLSLLRATHEFYSYISRFRDQYAEAVKKIAASNPLSMTRLSDTQDTNIPTSDSGEHPTPSVTTAYFPPSLLSIKKTGNHARRTHKEISAVTKLELKQLEKILNIKPPVTQEKIVTLLGMTHVPLEKFVSQRVDVLIRKYLTAKSREFVEDTFRRVFFTGAPPFATKNTVNVTWENDMKGLMKLATDADGLVVKRPTERLTTIISYCKTIINGAYKNLDDPIAGLSVEAEFLNLVRRFNGYTLFINNISQNMRFNASSLLFTYFHKTSPNMKFQTLSEMLSDIRYGSVDVEEVLLKYVITDDVGNTDEAVKDPYNIVTLSGHAYDQVRPALRAEFVLLKFFFYLSQEYKRLIPEFIRGTYKRKFDQIEVAAFSVNNVLQLCPGLMTLMFYMINLSKKADNMQLIHDINHKFKVVTSVKGYAGRQEGIELQKAISRHIEDITVRCMDLLLTKTIKKTQIIEYVNLLFFRSGLMKDAGFNIWC